MSDDIEVVRRALMMRDAGYGNPRVWEQVGSLLKEHDRLRTALAEVERERKSIRDTCVALNEHNDELDARLDEALARAERAEADLAAARELFQWMDRKGGLGLDVHDAIRAFLERTANDATDPG